jgi:hypothetical protein
MLDLCQSLCSEHPILKKLVSFALNSKLGQMPITPRGDNKDIISEGSAFDEKNGGSKVMQEPQEIEDSFQAEGGSSSSSEDSDPWGANNKKNKKEN